MQRTAMIPNHIEIVGIVVSPLLQASFLGAINPCFDCIFIVGGLVAGTSHSMPLCLRDLHDHWSSARLDQPRNGCVCVCVQLVPIVFGLHRC